MRLALVGAILLLLFGVGNRAESKPPPPSAAYSATQPKSQSSGAQSKTDDNKPAAKNLPPSIEIVKTPIIQVETAEKTEKGHDYSSSEWWLVYLTFALVLVTALLAAYTAKLYRATVGLGKDAKTTSDRQATEMEMSLTIAQESANAAAKSAEAAIAAQRPWLSVAVQIGEPLMITEEEIRIDLILTITNSGNTPAVNIRVIPQLAAIPIKDGLDFELGIKKALVISDNWNQLQHRIGRTIFPKSAAIERHVVQLPRSELLESVATGDNSDPSRIILNLGGCVDYIFGTGKGQTTFSYVLMERHTNHMGVEISPHVVPLCEILMREESIGVYAK